MKVITIIFLSISLFASVNNYANFVEVQGHRGARGLFPENTLPAFAAAIEAGADTLELDLQVTLDGEIVVHHDYFIHGDKDKTSQSLVRFLQLSDLKKLDYGSETNPNFPRQQRIPGTQIPTLDELFVMIHTLTHPNAKNVKLNLEIKRDPRYPDLTIAAKELARKIVTKVQENDFSNRVYYSSFDPEVLTEIYQLDPQAELGFIFGKSSFAFAQKYSPEDPLALLLKLAHSFEAKVLSPEYVLLTDAKVVQDLHQAGYRVVSWTVNSPEEWTTLIEMGVDGLITDYPHDLLKFLEEKGLR